MARKTVDYGINLTGGKAAIADLKNITLSTDQLVRKAKELGAAGLKFDTGAIAKRMGLQKATIDKLAKDQGWAAGGNNSWGSTIGGALGGARGAALGGRIGGALAGGAGGALAAVAALGPIYEQATAVRNGEKFTSEAIADLAKRIPLFGRLAEGVEGGIGLAYNAFGAESPQQAAANARQMAEMQDSTTANMRGYGIRRRASGRELASGLASAAGRQTVGGMEGYGKEIAQSEEALASKRRDIADKLAADVEGIEEKRYADTVELYVKAGNDPRLKAAAKEQIKIINKNAADEKEAKKRAAKQSEDAESVVHETERKKRDEIQSRDFKRSMDNLANDRVMMIKDSTRRWMVAYDHGFSAEISQLKDQNEEKKRIMKQEMEEKIRQLPIHQQALYRAETEAKMAAMDSATKVEKQARYHESLRDGTRADLGMLAGAGDAMSGAAGALSDKARALASERDKWQAIANDPDATPSQRENARRKLAGMDGREAKIANWNLRSARMGALGQQANLPGAAGYSAQRELTGMGLENDFDATAASLQNVLKHGSPEDKQKAMETLQGLASTTALRFGNQVGNAPAMGLVSGQDASLMTGVADTFKSNNDPMLKVTAVLQQGLEVQLRIEAKLDGIARGDYDN